MAETVSITVKTRVKIIKFEKGEDKPFETIVQEEILSGKEAEKFIKRIRGDFNATNERRTQLDSSSNNR